MIKGTRCLFRQIKRLSEKRDSRELGELKELRELITLNSFSSFEFHNICQANPTMQEASPFISVIIILAGVKYLIEVKPHNPRVSK